MKSEKSFEPHTGFNVHDHTSNNARSTDATNMRITARRDSAVRLEKHTVLSNQSSVDPGRSSNKSSTFIRHPGLSDAGKPSIPRRTSSINLKSKERRSSRTDLILLHRQSCLLFSSLDSSLVQQRNSATSQDLTPLQDNITALPQSSENITTSYRNSFVGNIPDDSPLGFTMARKRTSLPSVSDCRASRTLSKRDSRLSFRSSFLSSFPEPPATPAPALPTLNHLRNTSTYHVFPQQRQPTPTSPSAAVKSRPPVTTTDSYSSNPNIDQEIYTKGLASPTSISWTSPATRQAEYAKIDRAQCSRQKVLRKFAPKWLCGSLGSERGKFYDDDDGKRSVRRFRIDRPVDQAMEGKDHSHNNDSLRSSSDGKPSVETTSETRNSSTSQLIDEKKTLERQRKKTKGSGWARFTCF